MQTAPPLILTLSLNTEAQLFFNELRKQHFPAERNFLDAHLTLFHQLPAHDQSVINTVESIAEAHKQIKLQATAIVSIGNGVAYKVESGDLQALHKKLQQQWEHLIIPQDKQKLWPHITIQNKVLPATAKALIEELSSNFTPFEFTGTGLSLWEYHGGPWQFVKHFPFDTRL